MAVDPALEAAMDSSSNPVATAIDGATGDWSMSGDAMRWSPDLAEEQGASAASREKTGVEEFAGGLGLDVTSVRRFVSDALSSLGAVATDVVSELRQLTRGGADDEER